LQLLYCVVSATRGGHKRPWSGELEACCTVEESMYTMNLPMQPLLKGQLQASCSCFDDLSGVNGDSTACIASRDAAAVSHELVPAAHDAGHRHSCGSVEVCFKSFVGYDLDKLQLL
jgi:hypothetical protein